MTSNQHARALDDLLDVLWVLFLLSSVAFSFLVSSDGCELTDEEGLEQLVPEPPL